MASSDSTTQPMSEVLPEDQAYLARLEQLGEPDGEQIREIARSAVPLPDRLQDTLLEWQTIHARNRGEGPLYPNPTIYKIYQERHRALMELGLHRLPARTAADCTARLQMLRSVLEAPGGLSDRSLMTKVVNALLEDMTRLETSTPAPSRREEPMTTATQRRAAVIAHLCDPEMSRWSDRAIARACGVSPQTVGNWRRKLSDEFGQGDEEAMVRFYQREGRTYRMKVGNIGTH